MRTTVLAAVVAAAAAVGDGCGSGGGVARRPDLDGWSAVGADVDPIARRALEQAKGATLSVAIQVGAGGTHNVTFQASDEGQAALAADTCARLGILDATCEAAVAEQIRAVQRSNTDAVSRVADNPGNEGKAAPGTRHNRWTTSTRSQSVTSLVWRVPSCAPARSAVLVADCAEHCAPNQCHTLRSPRSLHGSGCHRRPRPACWQRCTSTPSGRSTKCTSC